MRRQICRFSVNQFASRPSLTIALSLIFWSTSSWSQVKNIKWKYNPACACSQSSDLKRQDRVELSAEGEWKLGHLSLNLHPQYFKFLNEKYQNWGDEWDLTGTGLKFRSPAEDLQIFLGAFATPRLGTDGINPHQFSQPLSLSHPLDSRKKAHLGLQVQWDLPLTWESAPRAEVFFVPKAQKTQLPGPSSPWWPRQIPTQISTQQAEVRLPSQVEYEFLPRQELQNALGNQFGFSLSQQTTDWEWQLSYFQGASDFPDVSLSEINALVLEFEPRIILESTNPLRLQITDWKRETWGWGGALPLFSQDSGWTLRWAQRWDRPLGDSETLLNQSPRVESAVGLEKIFNILSSNHIFITTWGGTSRWEKPNNPGLKFQTRMDRWSLFAVKSIWSEKWDSTASILLETQMRGTLGQLDLGRTFFGLRSDEELFRVGLGLSAIDGPQGTLLGAWKNQSQIYLSLGGSFQ